MKRYGRALIAGVIFLGLLGWVLTQERGRAPQQGEAFGLDAKQATGLQVKTETQQLTLQKDGEQWTITEPIKGWADKDAVERMLKAVAELKPTGKRTSKDVNVKDPKFGLDKPAVTATLSVGQKTFTVQLGAMTANGSEYFAKIDNRDEVYFVPASLQSDLAQSPDLLRDKTLAHFEKEAVQSVTLQYPDRVVSIEKRGTDEKPQWYLTKPYEAKADEFSAKQLAEKLAGLKADGFAQEPAPAGSNYGFDKPVVKATVTTKDNKQYVITIGATTQGPPPSAAPGAPPPSGSGEVVYAQLEGRPEVLLLPSTQANELKKTDMELRDKRILELDKANVTELRVERKDGLSFTVRRLADGWQLSAPTAGRAKSTKVDDILWDLSELEAREFLGQQQDLKPYGLALPDTIITATLRGQKDPLKVYVGYKKDEGLYWAKTAASDQVYLVGEMLLLDLPKKVEEIKEPPGTEARPAAGAVPGPEGLMPPSPNSAPPVRPSGQ